MSNLFARDGFQGPHQGVPHTEAPGVVPMDSAGVQEAWLPRLGHRQNGTTPLRVSTDSWDVPLHRDGEGSPRVQGKESVVAWFGFRSRKLREAYQASLFARHKLPRRVLLAMMGVFLIVLGVFAPEGTFDTLSLGLTYAITSGLPYFLLLITEFTIPSTRLGTLWPLLTTLAISIMAITPALWSGFCNWAEDNGSEPCSTILSPNLQTLWYPYRLVFLLLSGPGSGCTLPYSLASILFIGTINMIDFAAVAGTSSELALGLVSWLGSMVIAALLAFQLETAERSLYLALTREGSPFSPTAGAKVTLPPVMEPIPSFFSPWRRTKASTAATGSNEALGLLSFWKTGTLNVTVPIPGGSMPLTTCLFSCTSPALAFLSPDGRILYPSLAFKHLMSTSDRLEGFAGKRLEDFAVAHHMNRVRRAMEALSENPDHSQGLCISFTTGVTKTNIQLHLFLLHNSSGLCGILAIGSTTLEAMMQKKPKQVKADKERDVLKAAIQAVPQQGASEQKEKDTPDQAGESPSKANFTDEIGNQIIMNIVQSLNVLALGAENPNPASRHGKKQQLDNLNFQFQVLNIDNQVRNLGTILRLSLNTIVYMPKTLDLVLELQTHVDVTYLSFTKMIRLVVERDISRYLTFDFVTVHRILESFVVHSLKCNVDRLIEDQELKEKVTVINVREEIQEARKRFLIFEVFDGCGGLLNLELASILRMLSHGTVLSNQRVMSMKSFLPLVLRLAAIVGAEIGLDQEGCAVRFWLRIPVSEPSDAEVAALPSGLQPRPVERTLPSIVETWRQAVDTSVTEERELTLDALNNDEFKSTDMPVLPDATAASATVPSPGAKTDLHGLNILVVDDDTVIRKQVKMLLTKFGCKCTVLSDGKKVVDEVTDAEMNKPYSLVLLDIQLPEVDGKTICKRIRELNFSVPLVAMTSATFQEDLLSYFRLGFNAALPKPFSATQLKDTVIQALLSRPQGKELARAGARAGTVVEGYRAPPASQFINLDTRVQPSGTELLTVGRGRKVARTDSRGAETGFSLKHSRLDIVSEDSIVRLDSPLNMGSAKDN